MKKSKLIQLVLICAALASCHKKKPEWTSANGRVYTRGDSSAPYYDQGGYSNYGGFPLFAWYYAFHPYGYWYGGGYVHGGYYSNSMPERCNVGANSFKTGVVRGGFGRGFSVSS